MTAGPESPGEAIRRSPNIWDNPAVYELENLAVDRGGELESAIRAIRDWSGADVLDIGCGTGFHLPRFAAEARSVIGAEPHPPLAAIARRRTRRLSTVRVIEASAGDLGLASASIDVAHARWAYFFGPGCEPGLAELDRVIRPGGAAFVIDNDATTSTFGAWFRRGFPEVDPDRVAAFWEGHGWQRERLLIAWECESRADFEAITRIELPTAVAQEVLAAEPARTSVDYAVNLWWRRY